MTSNKNQHFVPKAYLRRFGNPDGKSIHLLAIEREQIVRGASIKSQCSRNYFYGDSPAVENFIQFFEGKYGAAMQALESGELTETQLRTLVRFLVLQILRTPHMLSQRAEAMETFNSIEIGGQLVGSTKNAVEFNVEREMQQQLYICAKETDILSDLKVVLILNKTTSPFVTSDNPAFLLNRLYQQRYGDETSGLIQSGLIACMPLNPSTMLMAYDDAVYEQIGKNGIYELKNATDVDRFNQIQVQFSTSALYFQKWDHAEYIQKLAAKYKIRRKSSWLFSWTGVYDGDENGLERYRRIKPEDAGSTAVRVTSISPILPAPTTWPAFLKFKLRPRGFTTGSAVGYVRAGYARKSPGKRLRQEVLPRSIPRSHTPQGREVIWQRKD